MSKIRSVVMSSAALVVALSFGVSASALAHQGRGSDDANASNTTTTAAVKSEDSTSHNSSSSKTEVEVETHNGSDDATITSTTSEDNSSHAELHSRGKAMVKELEKKHKVLKTEAQRKQVCENHKGSINGKMHGLLFSSQKIQRNIDSVYTKAQAYQQKNNLQPAGYADLVAAADLAKSQAAASVSALQSLSPTVTCNGTNSVDDVATYKAAAQQARDDLKTYRDDVKAVLKALIDAKKTDDGSTN